MITRFYERYARTILWCLGLSFPLLYVLAESLPSNNDVEAWLPAESEVRERYDEFKEDFGAEETILVGLVGHASDDPIVEALAGRIERLRGIRACWTPGRLQRVMNDLGVNDEVAAERLRGLVLSPDGDVVGLVAVLSDEGLTARAETVGAVRRQIAYCDLDPERILFSGAPVIVTELDRLGSRENGKKFFIVALVISFGLLYLSVGRWQLSLAILGLTVWAINFVLAIVWCAGGEMNFIMSALSVLVLVFTMAIAIHLVHYTRSSMRHPRPLDRAFGLAWKPCCLATLTTVIGLLSLMVSDMPPVVQFGMAASLGCTVALLTGLFLVPAVLVCCPLPAAVDEHEGDWFGRVAHWLLDHRRSVAGAATVVVLVAGIGVPWIATRIDPIDFLPRSGKVASDVYRIEDELTRVNSIEAVVDFGPGERPFAEKLAEVRRLEAIVRSHPAVSFTMSGATFFPERMPDSVYETASLLERARSLGRDSDFVRGGQRLWRISARIDDGGEYDRARIFDDLVAATAGEPIAFTGLAPLLEHAQKAIFAGFWESFSTAFLIISGVMIVSLRSLKAGLVAMVPNLTPIAIVFGVLGWVGFPVDIGMTMTASIALGIAVDGTFHFLVRYDEEFRRDGDSQRAARAGLLSTGAPIFEAAAIASVGMLALTLSPFTPTARFGYVMATLLMTALVGDLVLLPALLSLRPKRRTGDDSEAGTRAAEAPLGVDTEGHGVPAPHILQPARTRSGLRV